MSTEQKTNIETGGPGEREKRKCQQLIEDLSSNRENLKSMLETIESFRNKLETYIPSGPKNEDGKLNYRDKSYSKFMMQENMKNVTLILNAELDVRKTIENSIKNEIDLRRKLHGLDKFESSDSKKESNFKNIREFSKKLKKSGNLQIIKDLNKVANEEI